MWPLPFQLACGVRAKIPELTALAGQHPLGFAVRLHTLGDFYSVDYVTFWSSMLDALPALHVFGFTANLAMADDETEAAIGGEIEALNVNHPDNAFIRFSGEPGQGGARVFDNKPPRGSAEGAGVLMCPAQTGATAACATCGLCWSPNAWAKCIGFLRHGMKAGRHRRKRGGTVGDRRPAAIPSLPAFAPAPDAAALARRQEAARLVAENVGRKPAPVSRLQLEDERGVVYLNDRTPQAKAARAKAAASRAGPRLAPNEMRAMIEKAIAEKGVTVCPPTGPPSAAQASKPTLKD